MTKSNASASAGASARSAEAHGGDIYNAARLRGLNPSDMLDFSASINPLGPPKAVRDLIRKSAAGSTEIIAYPEPDAGSFLDAVAATRGLERSSLIAGNGSTELIYLLPQALGPKTVLIAAPTFSEYARAARIAGARIMEVTSGTNRRFRLDLDKFAAAMKDADMAFLCNPANPTGEVLDSKIVLGLARAARRHKCLLVVDEAFMDFVPGQSIEHQAAGMGAVVLRSMTKFYALAGLRIGYGTFPRRIHKAITGIKPPWSVNALAARAGAIALGDEQYAAKTISLINRERTRMEAQLHGLGLWHMPSGITRTDKACEPGEACEPDEACGVNYIMLRVPGAGELAAQLINNTTHGIMIRLSTGFRAMGKDYIRVAVKSRKHNDLLLNALRGLRGLSPFSGD